VNALQKVAPYLFPAAIACLYYLLNASVLLGHYDLGWHLAAGDLIRKSGHIPLHDPWSFTAGNTPWFNLSWGWDALASALFQHAGFQGLVLAVVACGAVIAVCLADTCRRLGASVLAVCIMVLLAALLYPSYVAFPNIYLAAAPNMATMLFAVLFYGACLKRTWRVLLLPILMLAWVNLHGGFLIGLLIIAIFAAMALLRRDWKEFRLFVLAGVGALAATLINPLGWQIYGGAGATVGNFVQDYITEWWPYYRNISWPGSLPAIAYMVAFAGLELRCRTPCPWEARILSWLFLGLGLYQFRYMSFFFLFSSVPLALHFDRLLPELSASILLRRVLGMAGLIAAFVLPLVFLNVSPALGLTPLVTASDVRYLETHYPHARLLNHWNYGGNLIFYDRGAVPLFVDGRAATAYPESLLRDYFKLPQTEIDEAGWDGVLAKYRIDAVLWMNSHDQLRQFLVNKRGWKEVYRGAFASLYVRP
jgi:hypothetical protein